VPPAQGARAGVEPATAQHAARGFGQALLEKGGGAEEGKRGQNRAEEGGRYDIGETGSLPASAPPSAGPMTKPMRRRPRSYPCLGAVLRRRHVGDIGLCGGDVAGAGALHGTCREQHPQRIGEAEPKIAGDRAGGD